MAIGQPGNHMNCTKILFTVVLLNQLRCFYYHKVYIQHIMGGYSRLKVRVQKYATCPWIKLNSFIWNLVYLSS